MSAYGWFTFGMVTGMILVTLFLSYLEALDRRLHWVEALITWLEKQLPQ